MLKKFLIVLMCVIPEGLFAEESEPQILVGMAGEVLVPAGESLKEFYNTGFGVTISGQFGLSRQLVMTLTAGYVSFPSDAPEGIVVEDGSMIPVVAGLKFCLPAKNVRIFAALEGGVTLLDRWVSSPTGQSVSSSTWKFTWQPVLGFESRLGNNSSVEVSSRYVFIQDNESIGIRIGILFGI